MTMQKSMAIKFAVQGQPKYVAAESRPDQNYYFFAYRVSIKNSGSAPAQLVSRHWIITDGNRHTEEVRGPGVVGVQPRIQPGQTYEYESVCPLPTSSGSMRGTFQMVSDDGENFEIEIPEFFLISPQALH